MGLVGDGVVGITGFIGGVVDDVVDVVGTSSISSPQKSGNISPAEQLNV